jgi:hypothetical protein
LVGGQQNKKGFDPHYRHGIRTSFAEKSQQKPIASTKDNKISHEHHTSIILLRGNEMGEGGKTKKKLVGCTKP